MSRWWQDVLSRPAELTKARNLFKLLPAQPRCKICNAPFGGFGGVLMRAINRKRSTKNSTICSKCEDIARRRGIGAEVETTLLFADVRGSTAMAEGMSATEFTELMNRFFGAANRILVNRNALIDKMVGDQVIGIFIPALAGEHYLTEALAAARELVAATMKLELKGQSLPIGVGLHRGLAYVGTVGSEDTVSDITVMGDTVNTTARLSSVAGAGEILVSEALGSATGLADQQVPTRALELKGKSQPLTVYVL